MYIVNNQEMQAIDQRTIDQWEVPSQVLMESAGLAVVEALFRDEGHLAGRRVLVVAGPGNNGGDGLVVARHLYMRGAYVTVIVLNESGEKSKDHQANRAILSHMPIQVFEFSRSQQLKTLKAALNHSDLVIDALFGTGLGRPLSDFYIEAIDAINAQSQIRRIAIDSPSGLGGDRGEVFGAAVQAHRTYALAYPKRGHFSTAAADHIGDLRVLEIGIPKEVAGVVKPQMKALDYASLQQHLPARPVDGHKVTFGRLGVIAGSLGTSGACVLTAKAGLRTGCGLVQVLSDKAIFSPVATPLPEVMVRPVAWPNPTATQWLLDHADAIAMGPGMGLGEEKAQILSDVFAQAKKPVLLDADALTLLAKTDLQALKNCPAPLVLTPHPGEMARLLGKTTAEVQSQRIQVAQDFAQEYGVVLVLKGHRTIVAGPEGDLYLNTVDSPALATAGSGDVLSGIIASFLAQGLAPLAAACAGVVLHGAAGQRCAHKIGVRSTVAGDLIDALGPVLIEVENHGA